MTIRKDPQRALAIGVLFFAIFYTEESYSKAARLTKQKILGRALDRDEHFIRVQREARDNFQNWLAYVNETSDYEYDDSWADSNTFLPKKTIVVAPDGSGDFQSIQEAVSTVPDKNSERVLIQVKAGLYWEKVIIKNGQDFITIEGVKDDQDELLTAIAFNSTAADVGDDGLPLRTYNSASFASNADNFIARNLLFKNTAPAPKPGDEGGQAVALRVSGDKSAFYDCKVFGNQDTLYDHRGRHFFQDCYVEGTIDFVFGNGRSLYKDCHLHASSNSLSGVPGFVTAQKVTSSLETGFSFVNSKITGYGSTYLGRAWGNDSRVVFANTFMGKVVVAEGWNNWGIPEREESVFYAEFNCTGPGANTTGRAHWSQQLNYEQAKPFLSISYINGRKWLQTPQKIDGGGPASWGPGLGPYNVTLEPRPYQSGDDAFGNNSYSNDQQVTQAQQPYDSLTVHS